MCGLVGLLNMRAGEPVALDTVLQMVAQVHHRGPDEGGVYLDGPIGLGHARLSIIDLAGGQQPIGNEDGTKWIVYNGEVFNYEELRSMLIVRGHQFRTQTDTEVILHLYEDYGPASLDYLNGQFAVAIWDAKEQELFLARDRVGIRPLFYTIDRGSLIFSSEIKAILAAPHVQAELDYAALGQIFTYWSPLAPRTAFAGIYQLPPGHYALVRNGELDVRCYWQLTFPDEDFPDNGKREFVDYLAEFQELLVDAACIRMHADVPVGAYLSGGLDSSTITAIIKQFAASHLATFSIAFADPDFDESVYQREMAANLRTDHAMTTITAADIGTIFPEIIWHTETPVLRTAPAPMYMLAALVREHGYKVVVTGEGADEFLAGYNIFKEAKVRRFWAKQPDSKMRPMLLRRLYPYISDLSGNSDGYLTAFFRGNLDDVDLPDYSHRLRWHNTSRTKRFFAQDVVAELKEVALPDFPEGFNRWHPLNRAQFLEATVFLPQYLLSSQGDRMSMAHAIEGRYPFLDHRVIEFCNRLPPWMKLCGMQEKMLLKKLGMKWLPDRIWCRPKKPYRAPIHHCFITPHRPDYVRDLLSPQQIRKVGVFKETAVQGLVKKIEQGLPIGETDDMALAGIISTQLVHHQFIANYRPPTVTLAHKNMRLVAKELA